MAIAGAYWLRVGTAEHVDETGFTMLSMAENCVYLATGRHIIIEHIPIYRWKLIYKLNIGNTFPENEHLAYQTALWRIDTHMV